MELAAYDPLICAITPNHIRTNMPHRSRRFERLGRDYPRSRTAYLIVLMFQQNGWEFDRAFNEHDLVAFCGQHEYATSEDVQGLALLVGDDLIIDTTGEMLRLTDFFVRECYGASPA